MVKDFKNLLLRIQEADDLKTWYTASGTRVLPMFSYDDHGLTLTIFMTGSNLSPNASAWVKAYTALSANVHHNLFITLLLGSRPISVLAIQTMLYRE